VHKLISNSIDIADLLKDHNKYITLVIDEIHIKEELVYDKHEGSWISIVDLGNVNIQLLELEAALNQENSKRPLASTLMVRGLFEKLNYPYAQLTCANLSGDHLFHQAVCRLERIRFSVLALICDGASPNRRFWKLHSKGKEMTYKAQNPYSTDGGVFRIPSFTKKQ